MQDDKNHLDVFLSAIRYAARDTHVFELSGLDGAPMPAAEPGAHIDVHLPNGMTRQYSLLLPSPNPTHYAIGIKRDAEGRGGSKYIFDALRVGQILRISQPRNNFRLVEDAPYLVLIAGGIGITPIWAMIQRLITIRRPFQLHYCCRSRSDMLFLDELKDWESSRLHFDEESGGRFIDLSSIVSSAPEGSHFYCCGPVPMLEAFERATSGIEPERVHVEYFTPKAERSIEGGFTLQLARSNQEFIVPPGKGILEVLRDAGMNVPHSCEEGICGACEARVISGTPDHRDSVLTNKERAANKTMMICCGGCLSEKLVLDL